jgi:tyrosine-protein kinase Etk/Wzc
MEKPNETIAMFQKFLADILKYWYVVAFCLAFTLAVAMFYIIFAARTYKMHTSVLIDIQRSNAYGAQNDDMLKVYELIEKDKNLQNEIFYLHSTPLIKSVIEKMDLNVTYYQQVDKIPKGMEFSMKDLYKSAPFIVIPNNKHYQPVDTYIWIKILNEEEFMIASEKRKAEIVNFADEKVINPSVHFRINGTFKFGQVVENPFVSFQVVLNSNYDHESFQGKDLFFVLNTNTALAEEYRDDLEIEASLVEATMVDITLKSDNIDKGKDFLTRLIDQYIENNLQEKNFLATKTIEHIDYQISDISDALGTSEQELQNIRMSSNVMDIDEKAQNIYTQLQDLRQQEAETSRRLSYLRQMDLYFSSHMDSASFLAPSSMGLDDPLMSGLIQELTTLNGEKQQIINNNQLQSPRLRTLNTSINNLKNVISENIRYGINTTNSELLDIKGKINGLNREFSSLPSTQRRLVGVERKFTLNSEVFMSLLEKRIQAEIIQASNLPDCELIEPPHIAGIQSPKTIIVLIGAFFLGLIIPSLIIYGKKFFSNTITDKEELKYFTNLPMIGSIPINSRSSINVVVEQPNSITSEAFLSVRSNLIYYLMGRLNQVILVTSTMAGEGKSFTSLNVASSLATTNNRTLLIEFDLRRPSDLYTKLNIRGLIGVSSYLINKASLDEITISSSIENLDIILAGKIPPNPIELLSSKRMDDLFGELKKKYDYIIIDTPPYGVLTDSFILMKFADIILYVSRLGFVKRKMLASSFEDIESKKISNVHILLNGENPKGKNYGKYYTKESSRAERKKRKARLNY